MPRDLHRRLHEAAARRGCSARQLILASIDVNVWLALLLADHVHRPSARAWREAAEATIGFTRITNLAVLRLLTTAAAMNGKPLSMAAAWRAYDRLFEDERVAVVPEPAGIETQFRKHSAGKTASPKLWADAWRGRNVGDF